MNNTHYLAILAGSAFFALGVAGCDAGDQREPGTTDPESSAMYESDETETSTTDPMTDPQTRTDQQFEQPERQAGQPQDRSYASPETQDQPGMQSESQMQSQTGAQSLATVGENEVIGKTVVSQQGEEIGNVEDVVMDQESQQQLAVVDVGGFLGAGEKSVAVPFEQLELSEDGRIRSELTRENLQAQPEYDPSLYETQSEPM